MNTKVREFIGYVVLAISCLLLYWVFISPAIGLGPQFPPGVREGSRELGGAADTTLSAGQRTMLLAEFDKCSKEIQARLEFESTWYQVKFLFLGTILLGFLAVVIKEAWSSRASAVADAFTSSGMLLASALGVIVSLAIDMQLRANRQIIEFMGLWIAHYVEPRLLGPSVFEHLQNGYLYGWETFLRASDSTRVASGFHNDLLYMIAYWPYVFALTIMAYAVYLCVHLLFMWTREYAAAGVLRKWLFVVLHLTIIYCAAVTHVVPRMFEIHTPWPIEVRTSQAWVTSLLYASGALAVMGLSDLGCRILRRRPKSLDLLVVTQEQYEQLMAERRPQV